MYSEGKLKIKVNNTSYCLIEVVTKADLTVFTLYEENEINEIP